MSVFQRLPACTLALLVGCAETKTGNTSREPPAGPIGTPIVKTKTPPAPKQTGKAPAELTVVKFDAVIRSVNPERSSLTVSVGGQDRTYPVATDAFIITDKVRNDPVPGGLRGLVPGSDASITIHKMGAWETVHVVLIRTRQ